MTCIGRRHLADLVEEERAAVGLLEEALLVAQRAGEGAALVAEQLALEQVLGQRAAVDRQDALLARGLEKWMARAMSSLPVPLSPWISTVDAVRATRSMRPKIACIRGAAADDVVECVALLELAPEVGVLLVEPVLLEGALRAPP